MSAVFVDVNLLNVEGRATILGGQLTAQPIASDTISPQIPTRVRPSITTHVLDVARGCPAAGVEVLLQMYNAKRLSPMFGDTDIKKWIFHGSSITDKDGRSGQLMKVVDDMSPGVYRISFNSGNTTQTASSHSSPLSLRSKSPRRRNIFMFLCYFRLFHSRPTGAATYQ